jgi:hypothetical protein
MSIRLFVGLLLVIALAAPAMAQVTPPAVLTPTDPALRLWLKADAGLTLGPQSAGLPGPPVLQWVDQSQYGTIMAPRTEGNPIGALGGFPVEEHPHLVTTTLNGNSFPTLRFDRDGDIFNSGDPNVDGSGSTDRLYQTNNLTPNFDPLQIGDGSDFIYFTVFNPDLTTTPGLGYQCVFGKRGTNSSLYTLQIKQVGQVSTRGTFENTSYDEIEQYITASVRAEKTWHVTSMVIDDLGDGLPNTDTIKFFDDESQSATEKMVDVGVVRGATLVGTPVTAMANRNPSALVPEPFGVGGHYQACCGEGETFAGNIAEIIIFARTLTPQEIADVENYLDAKYFAAPPMGVAGDYNDNGTVDSADYVLWRNNVGQLVALDNENPGATTPGLVDGEDYDFWRSRFGATAGSGAATGAAVPEPATIIGMIVSALLCTLPRFHGGRVRASSASARRN